MNSFFTIIFFFAVSILNMKEQSINNKNVEIITWSQAIDTLSKKGFGFFEPTRIVKIDEGINIFLYDISNDETIVFPEYPLEYFTKATFPCFIYKTQEDLEYDIKHNSFPVPKEFITILETEKEELLRIDKSYLIYIEWLNNLLDTKFTNSISIEQLRNAYLLLKQKQSHPLFEKLVLAFSIIINKFIIDNESAFFVVQHKNQGYKSLPMPCVRVEGSIINSYETLRSFDLKLDFDHLLTRVYLDAKPRLQRFNGLSISEYLIKLKNLDFLRK